MPRSARPTPDENARAAAVRLQIATRQLGIEGYPSANGGRVVLRLTPAETDQLIRRLISGGAGDDGADEGDVA